MEFSRQEYWSELPFPSPGDLPDPGIEPGSLALQADILPSEPPGSPISTCYRPIEEAQERAGLHSLPQPLLAFVLGACPLVEQEALGAHGT